jgi:hypothetical protein
LPALRGEAALDPAFQSGRTYMTVFTPGVVACRFLCG